MPRKARSASETMNDVFAVRLREIMTEKGINKTQLAEMISSKYGSIQKQTISLYTTGQSKPDTDRLTAIARTLNVSADYLLGISETKTVEGDVKTACEYLGISEAAACAVKDYARLYGDAFTRLVLYRGWPDLVALVNDIVTNNR